MGSEEWGAVDSDMPEVKTGCGSSGNCRRNSKVHSRKKKRNKRMRDLKYKKHLEKVWGITKHHYIHPPVLYVDFIWTKGKMCARKIPYYRREVENHGGEGRRFYKRQSNRRVRYYKGGLQREEITGKYLIIGGLLIRVQKVGRSFLADFKIGRGFWDRCRILVVSFCGFA